jgi:formylglycine-generating enzyme required for sulfatase activity
MPLTANVIRRAVLVAYAKDAGFVELVGMAELDRATAFRGASMQGTDLSGEDLSGFDFTGANFAAADVRSADFTRALGLTPEMFHSAIVDDTTKWPPNMRPQPFWPGGGAPPWVDDWGTDDRGRWVAFSVPTTDGKPVIQRMRWIAPGRFLLGSPDNETGRYPDEGPRQEVTIADGFWMFETTCTEALWEAVTGMAPSPRRGAEFPVTNVSWTDARRFIQHLNAVKPGLELSLPSEARWEYACRAGTDTPYSFGTEISRDLVCYDTVAPVPVGSLPPNGWGLYEMHGNVWEWCEDHWHDNYDGMLCDGTAWVDRKGTVSRVIRGGAWIDVARGVRAAWRGYGAPAVRVDSHGFRCARVQSGSEGRQGERRAASSKPREQAATSPEVRSHESWQQAKRRQIIAAVEQHFGSALIQQQTVYYRSTNYNHRIVCLVSKHHSGRRGRYWYGYKVKQHDFLTPDGHGYLVLGCEDLQFAFAIPASVLGSLRDQLYRTPAVGPVDYWHIDVIEPAPGSFALIVPNAAPIALDPYRVTLTSQR